MATSSIDEVAASGHPCLAFQLYVIRDHSIVEQVRPGGRVCGLGGVRVCTMRCVRVRVCHG